MVYKDSQGEKGRRAEYRLFPRERVVPLAPIGGASGARGVWCPKESKWRDYNPLSHKLLSYGSLAKLVRRWIANPLFTGSSPVGTSK